MTVQGDGAGAANGLGSFLVRSNHLSKVVGIPPVIQLKMTGDDYEHVVYWFGRS